MKYTLLALILGFTLAACEEEQSIPPLPTPEATASETPVYLP